MRRHTVRNLVLVALAISVSVHARTTAQKPDGGVTSLSGTASLALLSLTGKDSFDRYCATCHGITGRGDGTLASSLKTRPADLTSLAGRNGGTFPREQVRGYVEGTGRAIPAHGPTQMPLWGGIFRWLDSEARTTVRINNLVAYVESLQAARVDATAKAPDGAELFRAFCASCHGNNGTGDGVMAAQLTREPPNLTELQVRNRGTFPAPLLKRIIDGREIAAHGNRTMPVWGDVFMRQDDGGRSGAAARVDALVEFIQSIQQRPT
jgi:mono/diheme cytochrome c family protein